MHSILLGSTDSVEWFEEGSKEGPEGGEASSTLENIEELEALVQK